MTDGHEPIRGRVAAVLNSRQLIINRGSDHSVEPGMCFSVLEELNVTDPDTGEPLVDIPREVVKVRVIDVHPRYAVAHTYETYSVPAPGRFGGGLQSLGQTYTRVRLLQTPADAQTVLDPDSSVDFAVVDKGYLVQEEAA